MDGQRGFYEMENPTENPSKATEYLKELNKIIETQQGLLEKQRVRIDELELQVTDLCKENACLKDQHQRHLATCRLQQGNLSTLGAIKENVMQENWSLLCDAAEGLCKLPSRRLPARPAVGSHGTQQTGCFGQPELD
ncbi:IQ motif and SEC7 domain-containing protein 2 [Collichthys lucidus]|uniref:IQ motif and SEC7 domain-containing protein 2 n=1 Tax=Collichthys lucidus TaxID=240159 RepID=A0A4U5U9V3_COLLU|nr:IQ motif and SEC7 domain-containing protein 2 [Collichthys lucidus]